MDNDQPLSPNRLLVEALSGKSNAKALVFDRALEEFNNLSSLFPDLYPEPDLTINPDDLPF